VSPIIALRRSNLARAHKQAEKGELRLWALSDARGSAAHGHAYGGGMMTTPRAFESARIVITIFSLFCGRE
jgi:hypothetical protein